MGELIKPKKFKIKIRCTADRYEGELPDGKTFSQAVNDWWNGVGGTSGAKAALEAELAAGVNSNSYLENFVFESDADDKEAYD